jgi:hypothetical protein
VTIRATRQPPPAALQARHGLDRRLRPCPSELCQWRPGTYIHADARETCSLLPADGWYIACASASLPEHAQDGCCVCTDDDPGFTCAPAAELTRINTSHTARVKSLLLLRRWRHPSLPMHARREYASIQTGPKTVRAACSATGPCLLHEIVIAAAAAAAYALLQNPFKHVSIHFPLLYSLYACIRIVRLRFECKQHKRLLFCKVISLHLTHTFSTDNYLTQRNDRSVITSTNECTKVTILLELTL